MKRQDHTVTRTPRILLTHIGIVLFAVLISTTFGSDYANDVEKFKSDVPEDERDAHLAAWIEREPDNPDAYILAFNIKLERAFVMQFDVGGKIMPRGTFKIESKDDGSMWARDLKTGTLLGKLNTSTVVIHERVKEPLETLKLARAKFPNRADIHAGLITAYSYINDHASMLAGLRELGQAAERLGNKMRWCHGEELPKGEADPIISLFQDFVIKQYELETPEGDRLHAEMTKIMVEFFPNSPKSWNNLAAHYSIAKNSKKAHKALEQACKVGPDDPISLLNLGDSCLKLGLNEQAIRVFQHVVDLKPAKNLAAQAREKLKRLDTLRAGAR